MDLSSPSPVIPMLKEDPHTGVENAIGIEAHQQWWFRSNAAQCGGRRAVFFGSNAAHCAGRLAAFTPLFLLGEWRPSHFLPADVPDGRQRLFLASSMVFHGGIVIPSGASPVTAVLRSWWRRFGPDCVFHQLVGVLFAKVKDQIVISSLLWACVMVVLALY